MCVLIWILKIDACTQGRDSLVTFVCLFASVCHLVFLAVQDSSIGDLVTESVRDFWFDYPQEVPPQKDLLGGPFWGGTSWVHQSSESPTSIIMFYLYFHSLIWALGVIGHVYQGPNGDFCGRNRWDNKSWKFPKTHLKPENTFVMLNVVAVMFLNLTLSSFLHECRSTASTQVHL